MNGSLLFSPIVSADDDVVMSDSCRATYSANEHSLYVPCLEISSATGVRRYNTKLDQSTEDANKFTLASFNENLDLSRFSGDCVAKFYPATAKLHLPCVDTETSPKDILSYEVFLSLRDNANYFEIDNTIPLNSGRLRGGDNGSSCSSATNVATNSSRSASLETQGDVDYFKIEVPVATTLSILATGSTDTVGTLYDNGCNYIVSDDDSDGAGDFLISRLVNAGTYYIKVRHYSSVGTGSYTLVVRSETIAGALPPTTLRTPTGRLTLGSLADFTWDAVPTATRYRIVISTSSDFSNVANMNSDTATPSCTTSNNDCFNVVENSTSISSSRFQFQSGRTYYWKVRSANDQTGGTWSSSSSFSVSGNNGVDTTIFSTGAYQNNLTLTETLSILGASSLVVTVRGVTEPNYDVITIADARGVQLQRLSGDIDRTFTANGSSILVTFVSDGSATRSGVTVTIGRGDTPTPFDPPVIASPANGATLSTLPDFNWQSVAGADRYRVVFSNDQNFSNLIDDLPNPSNTRCTDTTNCYTTTTSNTSLSGSSVQFVFQPNVTYYWKVKAGSSTRGGNYQTTPYSFRIAREITLLLPPVLTYATAGQNEMVFVLTFLGSEANSYTKLNVARHCNVKLFEPLKTAAQLLSEERHKIYWGAVEDGAVLLVSKAIEVVAPNYGEWLSTAFEITYILWDSYSAIADAQSQFQQRTVRSMVFDRMRNNDRYFVWVTTNNGTSGSDCISLESPRVVGRF